MALTYVGDGATSTTPFHEGLNLAAVLKLLVIIAEKQRLGLLDAGGEADGIRDIADRAKAMGAGKIVEGNDVLEVYRATREAAQRASRRGTTLIEAKTMR